jgi:hypothetical protein
MHWLLQIFVLSRQQIAGAPHLAFFGEMWGATVDQSCPNWRGGAFCSVDVIGQTEAATWIAESGCGCWTVSLAVESSPGAAPLSVHLKKGVVLALSDETAAWYIKAQFVHEHLIFALLLTGLPYLVGAICLLER